MRLHRFFIKEKIENQKFAISDERLIHQWRNVFRYNVGTEVVLFDGSGDEFDCVLEKITNREAEVVVISKRRGTVPDRKIILYQSLVKKDKMEWIAEKATELAVSKIVPIISERSEKKSLNEERIQKIVIEASEQCGRTDVPEMGNTLGIVEALESAENIFVFDASGVPLNQESRIINYGKKEGILHDSYFINHNSLSIFIGPEGGWSEGEIVMFKNAGAQIYSLGKLTLRAETATIVALSKFLF